MASAELAVQVIGGNLHIPHRPANLLGTAPESLRGRLACERWVLITIEVFEYESNPGLIHLPWDSFRMIKGLLPNSRGNGV